MLYYVSIWQYIGKADGRYESDKNMLNTSSKTKTHYEIYINLHAMKHVAWIMNIVRVLLHILLYCTMSFQSIDRN